MKNGFLGLLALSLALSACGGSKDIDQRTVVVGQSPMDPARVDFDETLAQLKSVFKIYAGPDGFTREQITHVLDKLKEKFGNIIADQKLSPEQFTEMLFSFDTNKNDRLTWEELIEGLKEKSAVLKWLLENPSPTRDALVKLIRMQFPAVGDAAVEGAVSALFAFDLEFLGGNGDGKLSSNEVSIAGIILTFLQQSQCFKTDVCMTLPLPDPTNLMPILKAKLNKQLFLRYAEARFEKLSSDDFAVETIQLGARFFAVERLVSMLKEEGIDTELDGARLFALGGLAHPENWETIKSFFDNPLVNGDKNGSLNSIEAFHLLTEAMFSEKVLQWFEGSFSHSSAKSHVSAVLELKSLFSTVGASLFFETEEYGSKFNAGTLRKSFWDEFTEFDKKSMYGNQNGKLDLGELTLQLAYIDVMNFMFVKYDKDKDGTVSRDEAKQVFVDIKADDPKGAVKVFFAKKLLSSNFKKTPWTLIKIGFNSLFGPRELMPDAFYERLKIQLSLFL